MTIFSNIRQAILATSLALTVFCCHSANRNILSVAMAHTRGINTCTLKGQVFLSLANIMIKYVQINVSKNQCCCMGTVFDLDFPLDKFGAGPERMSWRK